MFLRRESENRVLRRIFGLRRDEVTGGWRKLRHEELRDLYSSPSIIRITKEDEVGGACSMNMEKRNAYMLLVGKPERKRALESPDEGGWIILRWILRK
jgi:hypothetical protein